MSCPAANVGLLAPKSDIRNTVDDFPTHWSGYVTGAPACAPSPPQAIGRGPEWSEPSLPQVVTRAKHLPFVKDPEPPKLGTTDALLANLVSLVQGAPQHAYLDHVKPQRSLASFQRDARPHGAPRVRSAADAIRGQPVLHAPQPEVRRLYQTTRVHGGMTEVTQTPAVVPAPANAWVQYG